MSRDEALRKLTALDFYLIDLNLYLNTHPGDREALMKYNEVIKEAGQLRDEYQRQFGMLSPAAESKYPWQWIDNPWPWQKQFNFELAGED